MPFSRKVAAIVLGLLFFQGVIVYTVTKKLNRYQNQPPEQFVRLKGKPLQSNKNKIVLLLPDSPDPRPAQTLYEVPNEDSRDNYFSSKNLSTTCPVTSQVRILQKGNGQWFLESLDPQGNLKSVGGDEFYIEFRSHDALESKHPTAVAVVKDLQDGTYALDFYRSLMKDESIMAKKTIKNGMLRVWLQYTCDIGRMAPPSKDSWYNGGYFTAIYWEKTLQYAPSINEIPTMKLSNNRTLDEYDLVLYIGDSIMRNLHAPAQPPPFQSKSFFMGSVANPLNSTTVDRFLSMMKLTIRKGKKIVGVSPDSNIAIILGSALWDVLIDMEQDSSFHNHLETIKKYIKQVKIDLKAYESDHFDIYWKLPTALHVHIVPDKAKHIARYMSTSRIHELYLLQKRLMGELDIPMMDYYLASYVSCSWLMPQDGRHYVPEFNKEISDIFFYGNNSNASINY